MSSRSGTFQLAGKGGFRLTIETPKGDSYGELNIAMSAQCKAMPGSGGAYTVGLDSMTLSANGEMLIAIPQLCWKAVRHVQQSAPGLAVL